MKRTLVLLLTLTVCLCVLTACGNRNPIASPSAPLDDGMVDDNGSDDGVLDTDNPHVSDAPVTTSPEVSGDPEENVTLSPEPMPTGDPAEGDSGQSPSDSAGEPTDAA